MAPPHPKYGTLEEFRASRGAKVTPLRRFVEGGASSKPGELDEVVMSTSTVDRASDTVNPQGWALEAFRANPVLLWCHDYGRPPVGTVSTVLPDGEALIGRRLIFVPPDVDAFGASVGAMYTHPLRFLRMFSVGFMPGRWSFNETRGGVDFLEQSLLELSCCPIGMNPDALSGAKSAGINMAPWLPLAEKTLGKAKDAPSWLDLDSAWMVHRTLAPRVFQVHPEFESFKVEFAAEMEAKMAEATAPLRAEIEAMRKAFGPPPALVSAPPPARAPDVAKALEGAREYLSRRTSDLSVHLPKE